jgi:NAD+ kinase
VAKINEEIMKNIVLSCLHSNSEKAKNAYSELTRQYEFVSPEDSDIIVALGGDGFLLHSIHSYLALAKPIFGINCGTLGFLLNENRKDELLQRIGSAKKIHLSPLYLEATMEDGRVEKALAFNEVSITRHSGQSANISIMINGIERLQKFTGDGIIVSTPAGSTAYNLSAHGPIIPLGSNLLVLTPVSPFRPRRWKGALLPDNVEVSLENLDPGKRPLAASADFREFFGVRSVKIRQSTTKSAILLFDQDASLEERILSEQFDV